MEPYGTLLHGSTTYTCMLTDHYHKSLNTLYSYNYPRLIHSRKERPQPPQIPNNLALSQFTLPINPIHKRYRHLHNTLSLLPGAHNYFHLEGVVAGDAGGDQGLKGWTFVETEGASQITDTRIHHEISNKVSNAAKTRMCVIVDNTIYIVCCTLSACVSCPSRKRSHLQSTECQLQCRNHPQPVSQ